MIFWLGLVVFYSESCEPGFLKHEEGCVSKCLNTFYNASSDSCEGFNQCLQNEYLNVTSNACESVCIYGFIQNSTCKCYAGWKMESGNCKANINYQVGDDYTFGVDWMYWGILLILIANVIYVLVGRCRYRKK